MVIAEVGQTPTRAADALEACVQCGRPAEHQALVGDGRRPRQRVAAYCCGCFNHDWPLQRLMPGRECRKQRVTVVKQIETEEWEWKAGRETGP